MSIVTKNFGFTGQVGIVPRRVQLVVTDNLSTVTTAGYLNPEALYPDVVYPTDIFDCIYSFNKATNSGSYAQLLPSITNGVITLVVAEGNVILPTIANHIATYTNTTGGLSEDAATAINGGNIQAGLSGTAGYLASFPSTASKGSFRITAVANTGNTLTTLSNAAMGQASVVSIPDPVNAVGRLLIGATATPFVSGNFPVNSGTGGLMVDSGVAATNLQNKTNIKAAVTANIGGAGAGPINVSVTGMTASSVVVASIATSSNTVSVANVAAGSGQFAITFSADPGATCTVNYVAFIAAQ